MTSDADAPEGRDAAKVATVAAAVLGAVLALGGLALYGPRIAISIAVGAAIAVANLLTMSAIVRAMLRPAQEEAEAEARANADADAGANEEAPDPRDHVAEGKRGGAAWGAFAFVKILVLFGGIYLLLTRGLVDPISLVVGYGVLPLGIVASSLLSSLQPRSPRTSAKNGRRRLR